MISNDNNFQVTASHGLDRIYIGIVMRHFLFQGGSFLNTI